MIRKQGRGYGVRVHVGGGRQRWLGTFDRYKDAQRAERDFYQHRPGRRMTVDEWAAQWLEQHPRPAGTTMQSYQYAADLIAEDFKGLDLDALDRPAARAWALAQPHYRRRVARTMFADAMRDGYITANPFTDLRLPTPKGRRDITPLTEAELHELADKALEVHGPAYGPEFRALLLFAGYTGARPCEYRRLEWSDIDGDTVHLRSAITKTGRPRSIYLPRRADLALHSFPRRGSLVFHSVRGRPLSRGSLDYAWRQVRDAAGLHDMDIYELRHVCATLLLERGLSHEDVRIQLGHRNARLVMELYGHPSEDLARKRIARALGD